MYRSDLMSYKCLCGLNMKDLEMSEPKRDLGFRKFICAMCGRELYTDIKDKTMCFECEKKR